MNQVGDAPEGWSPGRRFVCGGRGLGGHYSPPSQGAENFLKPLRPPIDSAAAPAPGDSRSAGGLRMAPGHTLLPQFPKLVETLSAPEVEVEPGASSVSCGCVRVL